jgi:hypothetical protein
VPRLRVGLTMDTPGPVNNMTVFQYHHDSIVRCAHPKCDRRAIKFVGQLDKGNTRGQSHDCCSRHCSKA